MHQQLHNAERRTALNTDSIPQQKGQKSIRLAEKEWPVPVLTARQNKLIDPIIIRLLPLFAESKSNNMAALQKLGGEEYGLLLEMAYHAISRASPELNYEAFLDMPVTLPELITAFGIIAEQTGIFARGAPGEA